jgi:hypothetical protein
MNSTEKLTSNIIFNQSKLQSQQIQLSCNITAIQEKLLLVKTITKLFTGRIVEAAHAVIIASEFSLIKHILTKTVLPLPQISEIDSNIFGNNNKLTTTRRKLKPRIYTKQKSHNGIWTNQER